jgi:hypothetical protein
MACHDITNLYTTTLRVEVLSQAVSVPHRRNELIAG